MRRQRFKSSTALGDTNKLQRPVEEITVPPIAQCHIADTKTKSLISYLLTVWSLYSQCRTRITALDFYSEGRVSLQEVFASP